MSEIIPRQSKTAVVRSILEEIGALKENPPKGWRRQVEEALQKQNIEMHAVSIYQIRKKAMQDGNRPKAKGRPKGTKNRAPTVQKDGKLSVNDLIEIQRFAERFGGLSGLNDAVKMIQSFKAAN